MPDDELTVRYVALPTLGAFHQSTKRRRGVMGPVGSGKSTGMCWEMMSRARAQAPKASDGLRYTRFAIIRNTYRELNDTTVKTWLDWFPEELFGKFDRQNMEHVIRDGDIHAEFLFRSLERPKDVKKLLSLELTGGWVNEARELPKGLIDALDDRCGRFPAVKDGGCTWRGLVMDTNPPDQDHWWYRLAEEDQPRGWEFFRQPGGLIEDHGFPGRFSVNPLAENLGNLEPNFYEERAEGKALDHIRVYYCSQYGFVQEGKPVHPDYHDATHCIAGLDPDPALPLYVGLDFGLTPAAAFLQRTATGRWLWVDELVTEDMGVMRFGELLLEKLSGPFGGYETEIWGDPAGDTRDPLDEDKTPFIVLNGMGIPAKPCTTNEAMVRREALALPMRRMIDGAPAFAIAQRVKTGRKGLAGGYYYRRVQVAGEERFVDKPAKTRYSHVVEACEYALLGAGEGRTVLGRSARHKENRRKRMYSEMRLV